MLSAIYPYNKEAIYYFSSIIAFIGLCIMGYVSTWPNANIIGKQSIYKDESKSIELPELKVEKVVEEMNAMLTPEQKEANKQEAN